MKQLGNYWVDKYENKWSTDKFTEEEAIIASASLLECSLCIDCRCCSYRTNCIRCNSCSNCLQCIDCVCSKDLKFCERCTMCYNCEYCIECIKKKRKMYRVDYKPLIPSDFDLY